MPTLSIPKGSVNWLLNLRRVPKPPANASPAPAAVSDSAKIHAPSQEKSCTIVDEVSKENNEVMSVKTFLDHLGANVLKIFTFGENLAAAEAPVIDAAFPSIAPLFNVSLAAVQTSQAIAVAAGKTTGSGPQKLGLAVQNITPVAEAFFKAENIPADDKTVTNWTNAFVALLNTLPQPTAPASVAASAPAAK
jgi:hypothetical protein